MAKEHSGTAAKRRKSRNLIIAKDIIRDQILTLIASLISLIESLVLILDLPGEDGSIDIHSVPLLLLYLVIIILAVVAVAYCLYVAVREYREKSGKVFLENDKESIDNYLTEFIESGDSVAILTHDMSWITDQNREMMRKKAKEKNLLLFLPNETEEVKKLQSMGADVRYFGKLLNDPADALVKSRMTVVNWNKAFPKLTYPLKRKGLHINQEIDTGEPANLLAIDLFNLLLKISETKTDISGGTPSLAGTGEADKP